MAEFVFLTLLVKQPFAEEAREWVAFCNMAIESFEWMMPLHAATKSRTMSKTFVDEWKAQTGTGIEGLGPNERRQSYNPDVTARVQRQNISNTSSPHINYLLQSPPNTYQQSFIPTIEFPTPAQISPQRSDASYSTLNPTRYDARQHPAYSTQTLNAAAAEILQSFSGTGWPNQGIFVGSGAMGWVSNFEDLFGDMSGSSIGG